MSSGLSEGTLPTAFGRISSIVGIVVDDVDEDNDNDDDDVDDDEQC